jgi:hypothetical protein
MDPNTGFVSLEQMIEFKRLKMLLVAAYQVANKNASENDPIDTKWAYGFITQSLSTSEVLECSKLAVRLRRNPLDWVLPPALTGLEKNFGNLNLKKKEFKPVSGDEVFQFEESNSVVDQREEQVDSEWDEEELNSIMIVTRKTSSPFEPSLETCKTISDGLYLYEKSLKSAEVSINEPLQPPTVVVSEASFKKSVRFVSESSAAPFGWLLQPSSFQVPPAPPSSFKQPSTGHTFGGRSLNQVDSIENHSLTQNDFASASFKEFTPFKHPSYELLHENGFALQKYSKFYSKAIKGIFMYFNFVS